MDDTNYWPNFIKVEVFAEDVCRVVAWHVVAGQHVQEGDALWDAEIGGAIRTRRMGPDDGVGMIVGPISAEAGRLLSPNDVIVSLWGITLEPEATEEELAFDEQHGPSAGMA